MRRAVLAVSALAAVGAAVPALAATTEPPVGVTVRTDNGVFVGTSVNGQPGVGAWVGGGKACVGASYQIPQCVDLSQSISR